jgi:signal transduction histidine kinase
VGLGLPIARKLSRAMGGDLWYEDRFPVGARFCFSVALQGDHSSSQPAEAEQVGV